jgi:hypothetical protein
MTRALLLCAFFLASAANIQAKAESPPEAYRLSLHIAPYVYHYRNRSDLDNTPWATTLELESPHHWQLGASIFENSHDQPSQYYYAGKRWFLPFLDERAYFNVTGGLLVGYKEPFEDKIPFNHDGLAPAIVPAIGYQFHCCDTQLVILWNAGLMLRFGVNLAKWQ